MKEIKTGHLSHTYHLKEQFIEFLSCKDGVNGEAISALIISSLQKHGLDVNLQKHGLDVNLLRGQGYDGASAMSERISGVAPRIQGQYPLAFYVHYFSHKLNLVIVNACQVQAARNAMAVITIIAFFFEKASSPGGNDPRNRAAKQKEAYFGLV